MVIVDRPNVYSASKHKTRVKRLEYFVYKIVYIVSLNSEIRTCNYRLKITRIYKRVARSTYSNSNLTIYTYKDLRRCQLGFITHRHTLISL